MQTGQAAYQNVLGAISGDTLESVWYALDWNSRRFLIDHQAQYLALRHPMTPESGEIAVEAIRRKQLHVRRMRNNSNISFDNRTRLYTVQTSQGEFRAPQLVTATGTPSQITGTHNPVLRHALESGLVEAHPLGGVKIDPRTCQVIRKGEVDRRLFFAGPLTTGTFFYASSIKETARQARKVVSSILNASFGVESC